MDRSLRAAAGIAARGDEGHTLAPQDMSRIRLTADLTAQQSSCCRCPGLQAIACAQLSEIPSAQSVRVSSLDLSLLQGSAARRPGLHK